MASRKSKREKRKEKQKKRDRESNTPNFPNMSKLGHVTIVPCGEEKMSDVLMEFVEPYEPMADTEDKLRKLLDIAMVAWNAALVTGDERQRLIEDVLRAVPREARGDFLDMISDMIRRKELYFGENTRFILDFDLTVTRTGPHLHVVSTVGTKPVE